MIPYNPFEWYWDNGTAVFSSKTQSVVPYNNAAYVAWLAMGGLPTKHPGDAELRNVLAVYGLGLTPAETATVERTKAEAMVADLKAQNKLLRAALLTMGDEINILRGVLRDLKANTAAAPNTVGGIKGAIAAIPVLPDRTKAQAITAITNKLNSGTADTAS